MRINIKEIQPTLKVLRVSNEGVKYSHKSAERTIKKAPQGKIKPGYKKINFVDNISDADFLVTNHYYQKGNPAKINQGLIKKFKLFKEFKVDKIPINSIYKIN